MGGSVGLSGLFGFYLAFYCLVLKDVKKIWAFFNGSC